VTQRSGFFQKRTRNRPADPNADTGVGPSPNAQRIQGVYIVPDKQAKLDTGARGQFMHCPSCGEEVLIPRDLRLECRCRALFTVTLGQAPSGDITVVKVERWR
jgi:hypothetical protein